MKIRTLPHFGGARAAPLQRGSAHAAAYDLAVYTRYHDGEQHDIAGGTAVTLHPGEQILFGTGVCLDMMDEADEGIGVMVMSAIIAPRSSLGSNGVILANTVGVIDADYRGEVKLALKNVGRDTLFVHHGMRVAQVLFVPVMTPQFEVVDEFDTTTARGTGGFGSTGE